MKKRHELPVLKKLNIKFDIELIKREFEEYVEKKIWNGLGSEYADLCKYNTKLSNKFFTESELKSVEHVCDLNWEDSSYSQISLTDYDSNFELKNNNSIWNKKIINNKTPIDERWHRKFKNDLPPYISSILSSIPGAHRTRFARLRKGNRVQPHTDYDTAYSIRLHIAIKTNSECYNGGWNRQGMEFKSHIQDDGYLWFVNPGLKHYAVNNGNDDRVHLIISADSHEILNDL